MHAHILDFPGAITCGADLAEARRMLVSALLDLANYALEQGESLPRPDPTLSDPDADSHESIHLALQAVNPRSPPRQVECVMLPPAAPILPDENGLAPGIPPEWIKRNLRRKD